MSKHNLGAWKIGDIVTFFCTYKNAITNDKGEGIAAFFGKNAHSNRDLCLIAPEMLEALKALCEAAASVHNGKNWDSVKVAKKIIAKAEGKQ